jgi:hypothetical protein
MPSDQTAHHSVMTTSDPYFIWYANIMFIPAYDRQASWIILHFLVWCPRRLIEAFVTAVACLCNTTAAVSARINICICMLLQNDQTEAHQ